MRWVEVNQRLSFELKIPFITCDCILVDLKRRSIALIAEFTERS